MSLTKEQIIEGNRIIYIFLHPESKADAEAFPDWWVKSICRYDSDWNQLMVALHKFDNLIGDNGERYIGLCEEIDGAVTLYEIEYAFQAIVDALKWLNNFRNSKS